MYMILCDVTLLDMNISNITVLHPSHWENIGTIYGLQGKEIGKRFAFHQLKFDNLQIFIIYYNYYFYIFNSEVSKETLCNHSHDDAFDMLYS